MMRRAVLPGAAVLVVAMLTGCGSGDTTTGGSAGPSPTGTATPPLTQPASSPSQSQPESPSPSTTPSPSQPASPPPASDQALGAALNQMIYGGLHSSSDGGRCFVEALEQVALSAEAQRYIVEQGDDRWAEVGSALRAAVSDADADLLMGQKFRTLVDRCADADLNAANSSDAQSDSDAQASGTNQSAAHTGPQTSAPSSFIHVPPKYDIDQHQPITTVGQLKPGLVSMFSSFGGQRQSELIQDSARCMSRAVLAAGFSQQTLHFLAGGAEVAAGSVAEYIPNQKDRQLWQSSGFTSTLSACLT